MDHQQDRDVVEAGGDNRDQDKFVIRNAQHLGHDKGRGAHDRRRDLPAARGRGLDRTGKAAGKAGFLHQRDGKRAGGHRVGDGRARNHAEEPRRDDRNLCRTARGAACDDGGKVDEQLSQPAHLSENTEEHEVEHIGRNHANSDPVNAFGADKQVVDDTGD